MRTVLAPAVFALAFSSVGCRQLVGIEDIVPSGSDAASDAAVRDALPTDSPDEANGDGIGVGEGGYGCSCSGCTTLAEGLNLPESLLVVGTYVYFLNYGPEDGQGSLMRVPTAGGSSETVAGNLTRPFSIAADANNLYWQAEDGKGGGIVAKRAMTGGPTITLASGLSTLQNVIIQSTIQYPLTANVAVTSTDVYFVGYSGGTQAGVLSVPIGGGTVRTVVDQWPGDAGAARALSVNGIVTDGSTLYAVTNGSAVGVLRVPLASGAATVLANNLVDPWTLALSGSDVYFLDLGLSATSGTLQEVPEVGGAAKILLNNLPSPWAIVSDNGSLYFVDETGPMIGSINALNVVNGSVKNLAFDLISPVAVAVDSKNVYWTDFDCGTVMKTSK